MDTKPSYFILGSFVIFTVAVAVAGVIFLGAGTLQKSEIYFETYIDESVQGLSAGSPVKHRGVQIGRVDKITFVNREYYISADSPNYSKYSRYVMVIVAVDTEKIGGKTPKEIDRILQQLINNGLRIRLTSLSLTGIAYLEADYLDPDQYPLPEIGWTPKYPYVPSAPSVLSTFTKSAEDAFITLSKIDIEKLANQLDVLLGSLNSTIANFDITLRSQRPEIEKTITNLKAISSNLMDLTEEIKRHPSQMLFSKPPAKSETVK
ncbi:MAG: MlaD family protein [Planctomycetota bacterium]|jgi:paraquat-inducible protein B